MAALLTTLAGDVRFSAELVNEVARLYRELIAGVWDAPVGQVGRDTSQR